MTMVSGGSGSDSSQPAEQGAHVLTLGHTKHPLERFYGLIGARGVQVLVDVRSQPYSRHSKHFNKAELQRALAAKGVNYLYLGKELGGRPANRDLYDPLGGLDYAALRRCEDYQAGLARVGSLARRAQVMLLCSEEDPVRCHRHTLIAPDIERDGFVVLHLRANGKLETEAQVTRRREPQLSLI